MDHTPQHPQHPPHPQQPVHPPYPQQAPQPMPPQHTPHMACPKCRGAMASYERSGVVIDQCSECRGIFLDRGELERFIDLAAGEVQRPQDPQWSAPAPDRSWRGHQPEQRPWQGRQDWDDDSDDRHRHGGHGGYRGKKRKSILGELLDF